MQKQLRCMILYVLFLGNAGGYLGLFLGYAALNVPELLQTAFMWIYVNGNVKKSTSTFTSGPPGASRIPILLRWKYLDVWYYYWQEKIEWYLLNRRWQRNHISAASVLCTILFRILKSYRVKCQIPCRINISKV